MNSSFFENSNNIGSKYWLENNYERTSVKIVYSDNSLPALYNDYLWSIARQYARISESKAYLMYGSDSLITYEILVPNADGTGEILVDRVDVEATLELNGKYYNRLYGADYFNDSTKSNDDFLEDLKNDEDIEFEWAMLEMDMDTEGSGWSEDEEIDEIDEYGDDELSQMNPEEMLEYIKAI